MVEQHYKDIIQLSKNVSKNSKFTMFLSSILDSVAQMLEKCKPVPVQWSILVSRVLLRPFCRSNNSMESKFSFQVFKKCVDSYMRHFSAMAMHLGFAVLQCSTKSHLQAIFNINMIYLWPRSLKQIYSNINSTNRKCKK